MRILILPCATGGGHLRAAGCTLTDFASIEDAAAAVVAEIEKQL